MKNKERAIPSWYVDGDYKKTLKLVFKLMKKRYTDLEIANHFDVPETTIKGFLAKKARKEVLAFKETLPSDHPRAANRTIRSQWLINGSRKETSAYITQQLVAGVSRTDIGRKLSKLSGIEVTNAMVNSYIANHMNLNFTQVALDRKLNQDNRFFSIHVIGSNPKALDRLQGV